MGKASRKKNIAAGKASANPASAGSPAISPAAGIFHSRWIHIVLIAVIGFVAYSNSFKSPFSFDSTPQIVENPVIQDLRGFISGVKDIDFSSRRYFGYLSFAVNYHFGGTDVTGYHVVNLLIHLANALLVYALVILTFRTPSMRLSLNSSRHDSAGIALFSALLFISHPVQTQAVTYIVQRFASLATLFYLLSVVAYVKGRLSAGESGDEKAGVAIAASVFFYIVSLLAAVCAMKTKEIAFTLPLVVLLYEFIFFKSGVKKRLLFLLPVLLTLIIVPYSILHSNVPLAELLSDLSEKTKVQTDMPRWDYFVTEMRVIVTYIRLIFVPARQNLDYDYPVYHSIFAPPVFLSFIFLVCILGLGIYLLYGSKNADMSGHSGGPDFRFSVHDSRFALYRLAGFGILWFFITLSVESGVIPIIDIIFEHRLYLPSAGVFIAITAGVFIAAKKLNKEKIAAPLLIIVTLVLTAVTFARNEVWKDEIRLWHDVAEKSPNKARPHYNLGVLYAAQGSPDKAVAEYRTALNINPRFPDAHNNLGNAYATQGLWDKAIAEYQTALQIKPGFPDVHNNLGNVYTSRGLFDKAIPEYQEAIKLKPDFANAHFNLGNAFSSRGLRDMAIREYLRAIELRPGFADAHNNLGNVYAFQGLWDKATAEYRTALELRPDYADAHNNLGVAYTTQGLHDKAIDEYLAALRLRPDFTDAHNNLGIAYAAKGMRDKAIDEYRTVLKLNPNHTEARRRLNGIATGRQ